MDIAERNKLIEEHLPFIRSIANRYKNVTDKEDLVQEGVLGIIRATETFDATKDIKFLTYASYWIKGYIARYLSKEQKLVLVDDTSTLYEKLAFIEDMEGQLIHQDLQEKTYDELTKSGVSARDLDIVLLRYLSDEPCTFRELGEKYGVSKQRIEQIEKKMIKKVKKKLKG